MAHLKRNGLLSKFQYGFRRNRCTELAVTHFTDAVSPRSMAVLVGHAK